MVDDITADSDMPAQVSIGVDHAWTGHQHTEEGNDPNDGTNRGQQVKQDGLETVFHIYDSNLKKFKAMQCLHKFAHGGHQSQNPW